MRRRGEQPTHAGQMSWSRALSGGAAGGNCCQDRIPLANCTTPMRLSRFRLGCLVILGFLRSISSNWRHSTSLACLAASTSWPTWVDQDLQNNQPYRGNLLKMKHPGQWIYQLIDKFRLQIHQLTFHATSSVNGFASLSHGRGN